MTTWRVKYDGACARCGLALLKDTPAGWYRPTRTIRCIECPAPHAQTAPAPPDPPPPPPVLPRVPTIDEGVAGGSARREHERRVARREARIEERYGHGFVGKVVRAASSEPQSTRAWAIGAAGEEKLARELAKVPGIRVLNDRRVPGTRGNIDHIVLGPAGVFVVDAKLTRSAVRLRRSTPWPRSWGAPSRRRSVNERLRRECGG